MEIVVLSPKRFYSKKKPLFFGADFCLCPINDDWSLTSGVSDFDASVTHMTPESDL